MANYEDLIGREDLDDIEAILSVVNNRCRRGHPYGEGQRGSDLHVGLREGAAPGAEQAVREGQDVAVERRDRSALGARGRPEEVVINNFMQNSVDGVSMADFDVTGTVFEKWSDKQWLEFGIESNNWTLSQFMHGEQGR